MLRRTFNIVEWRISQLLCPSSTYNVFPASRLTVQRVEQVNFVIIFTIVDTHICQITNSASVGRTRQHCPPLGRPAFRRH